MAHWHDFNPWADTLVYLASLEEYADCHTDIGGLCGWLHPDGTYTRHIMTIEFIMDKALHNARIKQGTQNPKVDCYILPQPSGRHDLGMRIGPEPEEYHSPSCDPVKAQKYIDKYRPKS